MGASLLALAKSIYYYSVKSLNSVTEKVFGKLVIYVAQGL